MHRGSLGILFGRPYALCEVASPFEIEYMEGSVGRDAGVIKGGFVAGKACIERRYLPKELMIEEKRCLPDIHLWSADTLAARPPNDEAMVLNSTCLISGFALVCKGSL